MKKLLLTLAVFFAANLFASDPQVYNIYITGDQLTHDNCKDLYGNGTVKFDEDTKTLILTNANLKGAPNVIDIEENDVTIQLNGMNTITSTNSYGIVFRNCTGGKIVGPGSATITGRSIGVYARISDLTIKECVLYIKGGTYGICGYEHNAIENVTIDNAFVNIAGGDSYTCNDLNSLTLKNCKFSTSGIGFYSTLHGISTDGGKTLTKNSISISPTTGAYPVVIMNMQLYSFNAADPFGDGTVSYDPTSKTLALNNANLSYDNYDVVAVWDNITIQLKGINTITTKNYNAIMVDEYTTLISGDADAVLNLVSEDNTAFYGGETHISGGCTINATGKLFGLSLTGEDLYIDGGKLTAISTATEDYISAIGNIKSEPKLTNVTLITKGIHFDATKKMYADENGNGAKTVAFAAVHVPQFYTLTISAGENGSVNTAVNGAYEESTSVNLIATANSGYKFEKWSDGNTDNPRTLVMDKDYTLTASFVKESVVINQYTITAHVNDATMGSVDGAGVYEENSDVTLTATANSGYEFVNWTKSGSEISTNATYTFKATEDITLQANFRTINPRVELTVYTIGEGTVNGEKTYKVKVNPGTKVTLNAVPSKTNYQFAHWNNRTYGDDEETTITIEMTQDLSIAAVFIDEEDSYKLTARAEDGEEDYGTVKITLCVDEENNIYVPAISGTYPAETILRVTAVAKDGYEFVCWNKDDDEPNTNESRKITLSGKRTLYAHFQKSTGLDDIQAEAVTARKFIRNGQLYIVRDSIVYDARGAKVE